VVSASSPLEPHGTPSLQVGLGPIVSNVGLPVMAGQLGMHTIIPTTPKRVHGP
jgi:hypothetical protein